MAATNKRGVFSLETVLERQSDNHWSKIPEVFRYVNSLAATGGPETGYWTGGVGTPSVISTVQRVDFANDTATASPKGPLSDIKRMHSGTGSTSYGYLAGQLPNNTNADRIDYSSDTGTATSKANVLIDDANRRAAVGNNSYGYWAGGTPNTTKISRLDFSNDGGGGVQKANISAPRMGMSGTGNQNYGYMAGGFSPANVDRIDYASDTSNTLTRGPLNASRYGVAAFGNSSYGYWAAGYPESSSSVGSTIARLDYASDTNTCLLKGNLTESKYWVTGVGTPNYGYVGGGREQHDSSQPDFSNTTKLERIDFSNDTATASPKGPLATAVRETGAVGGLSNALPGPTGIVPATRSESYPNPAAGPAFGYFGGGDYTLSTIDRVDYSNDTAVAAAKGPLADARYALAGTSNKDYGYFGGGYSPAGGGTRWSRIDRIDYASDGSTALVKGNMTLGRNSVYGTGNLSYGYFGGGGNDIYAAISTIDRVDYANDTPTASPKGPLSVQRGRGCAHGTLSYGYFTGGNDNTPGYPVISSVDRLDYASDSSTTTLKGNLTIARKCIGGAGNSSYGYISGGRVDSPSLAYFSTIDRIDYSNDTSTTSPKGSLSAATSYRTGTGDSSYGYMGGGQIVSPSSPYTKTSSVERIDYSNDTAIASPKGPLTVIQYGAGGASALDNAKPNPTNKTVDKGADGYTTSSPSPYAYFGGGYLWPSGAVSTIRRMDFSNDSAVVAKSTLPATAQELAGVASQSHGYWAGGGSSSYNATTFIRRLDFADDTTAATPKGNLATATYMAAGVGTKDYGYIAGGIEPSAISIVQRIDYSSDTSTASPKGNMTIIRALWGGATGNTSYAYFTAGWSPGASPARQSSVDRLDYSNDTATASPKGPLTAGKYGVGSTGNASYGYVGGGNPGPMSHVDRIDYGNDTATALAKGPLAAAMRYMSVTGNASYGYWLEGHPGPISTICRIDYSNDTASPSPGSGPNQYYGAGLSAADNAIPGPSSFIPRIRWVDSAAETSGSPAVSVYPYGYFGGGYYPAGPGYHSVVDRIDFSNDTPTATQRTNTTIESQGVFGVSNGSFGYFSGGWPGPYSTIDRIDYSNDTATGVAVGNMSTGRRFSASLGNASYGYFVGSYPSLTSIDRIDYSNDTGSSVLSGYDSVKSYGAGAGNQSYGWIGGGYGPSSVSSVRRMDYSNDGVNLSPKGPLTRVTYQAAAASNNDYGWYAGGTNPGTTFVDRIDYSNDTPTASPKGNLNTQRQEHGATGSASYGYIAGGDNIGSLVDRIDYSNDTATASPKGSLSFPRKGHAGVSGLSNALPQTGTPAVAAVAAPVQPPFPFPVQLPAPGPAYGYYVGGSNQAPPANSQTSEIDRIDFSNDTSTTVLKGNMHTGRTRHTSVANTTHGYSGGGNNPAASPAYLSSIERMTFANDTATSVDKSTFRAAFTQAPSPGQGANAAISIGNKSYGYWQGSNSTYVDRLDYSNDTTEAAATTNSTISGNYRASVGNLSYGYFAGGWVNQSVVDRLDYASDSTTMSPKGNLAAAVSHNFGVSNSNYGYIVAGRNTGFPSDRSDVQRIDFADDTATSSPKGPLAGTTYNGAGTGDASYAYVVQAQVNAPSFGYYTTIFRIDYSNDTATAAARSANSFPGNQMKGLSPRANGLPN